MENDKVKDLLEIMENHNLSEISLETPDGFKIAMKKAEAISENVIVKPVAQVVAKETPKEESKTEEKKRKYSKISNGRNILCKTITNIKPICRYWINCIKR